MNFAALLNQYGPVAITLVDDLIATIEKKGAVTSDEWDAIRAKGNNTAQDIMLGVLKSNGIDPTSEIGKAFLSAASHPAVIASPTPPPTPAPVPPATPQS
jgi:hypothetical protein